MPDSFSLTCTAFHAGESIPQKYTCDGANVSPALAWTHAPDGAASFALIVDDPDAPRKTFVHWVLFNLPPDCSDLPEDVAIDAHFADAAMRPTEGLNDFGTRGYGGPCPPPSHDAHRYYFKLYALDTRLDLGSDATKQQVIDAMTGHVLAETDCCATYQRAEHAVRET